VVDNLEGPLAKLTLSPSEESNGNNVHNIEIRHEDGSNTSMLVHANNMSSQFLPFQPPPVPAPDSSQNGAPVGVASSEESLDLLPQHRVYQAMFTIEETMDADGRVHVMAHSPEILRDGATSRQSRRLRYENALRRRDELNAISVIKRRKAMMKKKKLKKRRKAQRKLRERLKKL
jgi:mRNA-processing protein COX24